MIYVQTLLYSLRLVIITEYKLFAACIANALSLRSCEYNLICFDSFYECASSAHTLYNVLIRNINVDCIVDLASQLA